MKSYEKQLRILVWAYIFLLVFEGALRKWFLPGFSNALILARDPVVLLAYVIAFTHGVFPKNRYVISGLIIVGLSFIATMLFGHKNLFISAYGFRANILHFPFAFIIANVLYRNDVIKLGKWWLFCTIGMTVLICLQFYSPQSAWINVGPGGQGSAGFGGALGRYRPPGTFSFIIGIVWFFTFSTAFLVAGLTQHKRYSNLLMLGAAFAIVLALPVSISRMLILSVLLTFVVGILVSSMQKNTILRFGRILFFAIIAAFIAAQLPVFEDAREAFLARWEHSTSEEMGGVKGQIFMRLLNEFIGPFMMEEDMPLFGRGLGAGTHVGAQLLTGERTFLLGEGEWFRLTGESGILLAIPYILWRVLLFVTLLKYCMQSYRKGNGLGLIILSATAFNLLVGPLGQSTILGFTIIGIGLTGASLRTRNLPEENSSTPEQKPCAP